MVCLWKAGFLNQGARNRKAARAPGKKSKARGHARISRSLSSGL
jgi:hypothetical protein